MKTTQIVLHALPEELLSLVESWIDEGELFAAVLRIGPVFSVVQVRTGGGLQQDVDRNGVPFRVCLSRTPFELDAASLHGFMGGNVVECAVDIGALSNEGLKESQVTIGPSDGGDGMFWLRVAKELKARTKTGLWAVSPITGTRKFFKNNRYTAGAARLAMGGKKLLPLAGWNVFEIDPTESA